MFFLFKFLIWNKQRRGLVQYWWTGRSYPFVKGFKARRKGIWDREVRDGIPFEGSIYWASVRTAVNGKLHSWPNLFRMATWNRLFDLMNLCNRNKSHDV